MNMKAYRRNVKNACAACGSRVPNDYHTAIATNGDFVVYSNTTIAGRLRPGAWAAFL